MSSSVCCLEDAELRVDVPLERAVAVEVVGLEVEQDGDARAERLDVLELERRELADDPARPGRPSRRATSRAGRCCPATSTGRPAARKIAPRSSDVVVFPFVPGDAEDAGSASSRAPSSISLQTGIARVRAPATSGVSPGTPGLFTSRSVPCSNVSSSAPRWSSTPRLAEPSARRSSALVAVVADDLRALRRRAPRRPPSRSARARRRGRACRGARRSAVIARRTGGSRGRRARSRTRRGSRRRSRTAP